MTGRQVELRAEKDFDIRFSEVDAMQIVWHGNYALYCEDAREEFGRKYQLEYMRMYDEGFFAPIVELKCSYKRPLKYGDKARVVITLKNEASAKLVFDYEIRDRETNELCVSARSVQVFLNRNYELLWDLPPYMQEWKKKWGLDE